jgi:hypothetical protein
MATKKQKAEALRESFSDTMIALSINFPLNFILIWIAYRYELTEIQATIFLSIIFTTFAIIRKYLLRLYFIKRSLTK